MKILLVAEGFGGGVYEIMKIMSAGFADRGHEVVVAHGRRPETPSDVAADFDERVQIEALPWDTRRLRVQAEARAALRRLVAVERPDVVHLIAAFAGFVGATGVRGGVPTVYTPQAFAFAMSSTGASRRLFRLAEGFSCRRADLVGACSEDEGRLAREVAGSTPVDVVPNGIPELEKVVLRVRPKPEEPYVIALGRPVPQRRPEGCARILASLAPEIRSEWVGGGGGSRAPRGVAALERAGIRMTGWLPREVVLARLGQATAYLHWTGWDGLPLSVLEAMAADVLVVASDIGPNREVLGADQVCASEADAVALLREIHADPALYEHLLAGQRRSRVRYAASQMVDGWILAYRHVTGAAEVRAA